MPTLSDRLVHAWNAFLQPASDFRPSIGSSNWANPDRPYFSGGTERSIITSLYNKIAIDVAALPIRHCYVNDDEEYVKDVSSGLNDCLHFAANKDQTSRDFIRDAVLTMFDAGAAAIVPVDVDTSPINNNSYDIRSLRVGRVNQWFPDYVEVQLYNDRTGESEKITLPKSMVAIANNPFYTIMNQPNSTLQRLIHKLNLLDEMDDKTVSGKLDMIIQLPFVIKSEARMQQAEKRRKQIEDQLAQSKYGIAYTDGTEKVTQLNRPVDNNLLDQIKNLKTDLYNNLGFSEAIANGTAGDQEMLNYHNGTVEPVISAITDSMQSTFLTKTARTQGQRIKAFRDPFRLVTVNDLANSASVFLSSEVMTSNEVRAVLGLKQSDDSNADQLRNANINPINEEQNNSENDDNISQDEYDDANNEMDDIDSQLDELTRTIQNA